LAAKRAHLPLVIHEANAKAGWANRLGARLTRFVGENYPGSLPHAEVVGMPLMRSLIDLKPSSLRASAREHFGFVVDRPTLLVTGGSQGARRLNEVTIEALPALEAIGVDVLHICGEANVAEAPVASDRYRPVGFVSEMGLAYSAADYICCRAGATTVAEVGVLGLSALFVPLPIGNGEQHFNAAPLVRAGLAKQVADTDFRHQDLEAWVKDLVANPQECRDRSALLKDMVLRDGAERLAGLITRATRFAPVT
jgi:UDP-N-acetylglucosamine--N-acetylmuramyl-(pentapeptide) pyrophosphoryl-undecaprenol N-acetylglucosamine transferase